MKVLMVTGDKRFGQGHPRHDLQASAVEKLVVLYVGRGALWPAVPQEHFDVVTAQDPFWRGLFAWYAARRGGARLNIQVHTDLSAAPFFRHILAQIVLRHADSVRVVSEKLQKQVQTMGVKAPTHVLPIYVDLSPFKTLIRLPHEQKTILWFGRFEPEKDPLFALSALKEIREADIDAKLIMLGSGSLESVLRIHARELPIKFPGWQDPKQYLATADVVLSTSRHESWGASIVEALAAGVPVVSLDVGVAREAGAIVVPRSELARAVIEVLKNGTRGELKLSLPGKEEWAKRWRETLI
ncbi:hypothetical protein A3C95_01205 [Candidatus Kaiserbacteria bacterium RIFCSPHIGHO2_02_FULL_56_30]|uniref:Glycosyltransferase subfamily 4-like N-terminal domain-containing protein n=1 Tax=Candidatus Kaiserbacteria bacterium RIFCSPHIGHO2_02_FULL_56_30 TaxID=1798499 RepID=A0A1F6E2K8_9BACT|nr:MAG: hypothetical protein A3C95_01205 [Candidatus Kaiserbacteria bacterium RIFCSPHIGHO2_02_FULL_56_30]